MANNHSSRSDRSDRSDRPDRSDRSDRPGPPAPRAIRGKPTAAPAIFHVRLAERDGRGKCAQPVRIFHALHAEGRGEAALSALADIQRGLVHRDQLTEAGFTGGRIARLVSAGWLIPWFPRVYALGHAAPGPLVAETAAMLHVGHDAAVSHRSGAVQWDLLPAIPGGEVAITLIGRDWRARDGLRTHRVAALDSRDVRLCHGLPVTAPARTLIDFAADASPVALSDLVGDARARGLVDEHALDGALTRAPLRTGAHAISLLRATEVGRGLTRSHFERCLLSLITDAGLQIPLTNTVVNGVEVDALWPEHRLILECDSWAHHGDRAAFERDRRRDLRHTAHGYRVIRITYRQLREQPLQVIALLAAALSQCDAA